MKKILCVYATRQIDSNLFMASTVFRGLKEAGYESYMYFAGTQRVIEEFRRDYARYFDSVIYRLLEDSWLKTIADKHPKTKLLYSFGRSFVLDSFMCIADNQKFTPPIGKIATVCSPLSRPSCPAGLP